MSRPMPRVQKLLQKIILVCARTREKIERHKKTGRKIVGMLKAYSKNTHNVDEDFFSFWSGWNWATVWLIPQNIFMCISSCTNTVTECLQHLHTKKASTFYIESFNVFREGNNDERKKSGESGVAYSSIPITFTLSPFIRVSILSCTVHTQRTRKTMKYRRKYFFSLRT